jgi:transcriptional regulator with XRE-family HTH domain
MNARIRGNEMGDTGRYVAAQVRAIRLGRGETLETVAHRITESGHRITFSGLSKIENATRRVEVDDLFAIARALDVEPSILLPSVGTEPMVPLSALQAFVAKWGEDA